MRERLDLLLSQRSEVVILSGGAKGADQLGERYAKERGITVEVYPALWSVHGRSAGYIRNRQMAQSADALVAFWDGRSPGTEHMIDLAEHLQIPYRVIRF
jgi:predicted Rossmann-fold nucleotide-binding protein